MSKTKPRRSNVAILTLEGSEYYEQTNVGMLTQFFIDNNNINTGVKTFIVDDTIGDNNFTITDQVNYSKEICSVHSLHKLFWSIAPEQPLPVMFLFCHGSRKHEEHETSSFINFGEDDRNEILIKQSQLKDICLHDVIRSSKLVCIMCCAGDQILRDYLSEQNDEIPDILYYNCELVKHMTHSIFLALLIKIIDSDVSVIHDPSPQFLYMGVKRSIQSILFIVQQCQSAKKFWKTLLQWGCISKYTEEKESEGQALPIPRHKPTSDFDNYYRILGNMKNIWMHEEDIQEIFIEFQALTLVSGGKSAPVFQTHTSDFSAHSTELQHVSNIHKLLSELKSMSMAKSSI